MDGYNTWLYICLCFVDITLYFQIEYEPKISLLFLFFIQYLQSYIKYSELLTNYDSFRKCYFNR